MKKRLLSLLLAICLVAGLLTTSAFAAQVLKNGSCGGNVTWTVTDDDTLTISGTGPMVNSGSAWGGYSERITSVVVEEGVTSICDSAFKDCKKLTTVTLPAGLTSIGASAFARCSGLTSITFPDGLTSIGNEAFNSCNSLTSILFPASLKELGSLAFSTCTKLTKIIFIGNTVSCF